MNAFDQTEKYIFVSYAHKDAERVFPIIHAMDDAGFRVWHDESLVQGENYHEDIAEHITACTTALIFLSEASANSAYCKMEIEYAFSCGKKLSVVYLEENVTLSPGIQLLLNSIQSLSYCSYKKEAEFLKALFQTPCLQICAQKDSLYFLSEEKTSILNHIDIATGKIGKKVVELGETLEIMEAGTTAVLARKTGAPASHVEKRQLALVKGAYIPSANDNSQTGMMCLRSGSYFEAEMFFEEALKQSDTDGISWLGLLCTKLKDQNTFDALLVGDWKKLGSIDDALEKIGGLGTELKNAIEFSTDQKIAENVLAWAFLLAKNIIEKRISNTCLPQLVTLVLAYDSSLYDTAFAYFKERMASLASFSSVSDFVCIAEDLLTRISDVDQYVSMLETLIKAVQNKDLQKASQWNSKLLEIDCSNLEANMRALFFALGAQNKQEFLTAQSDAAVGKAFGRLPEDVIARVSKENAQTVILFLCDVELYCLKKKLVRSAEFYFSIITRYAFAQRAEFLKKQEPFIALWGQAGSVAFFDRYVKAVNSQDVDWHIEKKLQFAAALQANEKYGAACKVYQAVLALEESNYQALNGIFACGMRFAGTKNGKGRLEDFDFAEFEKILSVCPTKTKQLQIITQYVDLCISNVADDGDPSAACAVFDNLLRYIPKQKEAKAFELVDSFAAVLLRNGQFEQAAKYAGLSLQNNATDNVAAREILLLAVLECKNWEDFVRCENFHKGMTEYKMLLLSCKAFPEKLQEFIAYAGSNEEMCKELAAQREAQEIEQKQEQELAQRVKAQQEAQAATESANTFWGCFFGFLVLLAHAFVLAFLIADVEVPGLTVICLLVIIVFWVLVALLSKK